MRVSTGGGCCVGYDCYACCEGCSAEFRIEAPVGQIIGYAKQQSVVLDLIATV